MEKQLSFIRFWAHTDTSYILKVTNRFQSRQYFIYLDIKDVRNLVGKATLTDLNNFLWNTLSVYAPCYITQDSTKAHIDLFLEGISFITYKKKRDGFYAKATED